MPNPRSLPLFIALTFMILVSCAPATPVPPTATTQPTPEPFSLLEFDYTVHSRRGDAALERLTGVTWEGGYIWTPFVVYENDTYYLFYNGYSSATRGVGLATSEDGIKFTRAEGNPMFESQEEGRVLFSPVVYVAEDGTWVMFIVSDERRTGLAGDRIMRLTAPAPEGPWELSNGGEPVYEAPGEEHWTHEIVIRSIVVEDDRIMLGFDARHDDTISIGILESSDGMHFTLLSEDPVVTKGEEGSWEQDAVSAPLLFATEEGYEMFYMGFVKNAAQRFSSWEGINLWLGYATSPDAINWTRNPNNPVMNIPEEQGLAYISALKVDDVYQINYVYGAGAYGIGVATLTISSP